MRTEKVKLYGTHFFCILKNTCFSTHMGFGKIPLTPLKTAISLHRQKGTNKQDAHSFRSSPMTRIINYKYIKL